MNRVYLLTGGNIGNRQTYLRRAADLIGASAGTLAKQSALYETAAWGKTDQPAFLNQALEIDTAHNPFDLLNHVLMIEQKMGRKRTQKYDARIIDIDILFFNQEILDSPHLTIPHPQLHKRRFALVPLAEIAPAWNHPIFHKSVIELLNECSDPLPVNKI